MDLLAYLKSIQGVKVLSGQEVPEDGRTPTPSQLLALPKAPAIVGANILVGDADDFSHDANVQQLLTGHANAGGIISLCMHPPNFFSGAQNIATAWTQAGQSMPNLTQLYSPSFSYTTAQARYLRAIQRVIAYIKKLPASAPVIFRAWHEAGGEWFYWGRNVNSPTQSEAAVKALWLDTISRVTAACPNVIPAFSAALSYYSPILYGYPGPAAQLVGASLYSDTVQFAHVTDYAALVGTGSPVLLFEVGDASGSPGFDARKITSRLASDYPKICGWVSWQDGYSLLEMTNSAAALADPRTVNRADLPGQSPQPSSFVYAAVNPGVTLYSAPNAGASVKIPVY